MLSTAQDSTAHDSTPQRNPHLLLFFSLLSSLIPFNPLFHVRKITIIISGKYYCQEINMVALQEFGGLLPEPGYALPEFLVKIKNPGW